MTSPQDKIGETIENIIDIIVHIDNVPENMTYSEFWSGRLLMYHTGDVVTVAPPNDTFSIGDELIEWIDENFKEADKSYAR